MSVGNAITDDSITLKEVIILDIAAAKFIPSGQVCASDIRSYAQFVPEAPRKEWCEQILVGWRD